MCPGRIQLMIVLLVPKESIAQSPQPHQLIVQPERIVILQVQRDPNSVRLALLASTAVSGLCIQSTVPLERIELLSVLSLLVVAAFVLWAIIVTKALRPPLGAQLERFSTVWEQLPSTSASSAFWVITVRWLLLNRLFVRKAPT